MCNRTSQHPAGFTLIELIVFIVIVSVGLAGVLSTLNITAKSSADPLQPKQALAIAEALLEEVMLKDFPLDPRPPGDYACPTPATCDRSQFDDVSDYNNYASTGIVDINGSSMSGLGSYGVVSVAVADNSFCVNPSTSANEALKVTVTVRSPSSTDYTLTGYRCKY
jgi:MSHA pilin protein MshD